MKQAILAVIVSLVYFEVPSSGLLAQTSVTLGAVKDNTLYDDSTGSLSNGSGEHMFVGNTFTESRRRALIEFDIAGTVPSGSIIDSVTLMLYFSRTVADSANVELHRLLADWGEGASNANGEEGGGASATTNDATWIHAFYDTEFWGTQGGDYLPLASATARIGTFFDYGLYTWGSTPEMVADLQSWLDNPSANHGWILIGDESTFPTSKRFSTRENATIGNRPSLTVYYSQAPPPAPVLVSPPNEAMIGSDNVTFVWRAILPQVDSYWFELSTDSLFVNPSIDSTLTDTTTSIGQLGNNQEYWWRVRGRNEVGFGPFSATRRFIVVITGVAEQENPGEFALKQNYPNPFNGISNFVFRISPTSLRLAPNGPSIGGSGPDGLQDRGQANLSHVSLKIYDLLGREVATLVNGKLAPETYSVEWDATGTPSGVYFYRLTAGPYVATRKLILSK